jgi:hypothetical protein
MGVAAHLDHHAGHFRGSQNMTQLSEGIGKTNQQKL